MELPLGFVVATGYLLLSGYSQDTTGLKLQSLVFKVQAHLSGVFIPQYLLRDKRPQIWVFSLQQHPRSHLSPHPCLSSTDRPWYPTSSNLVFGSKGHWATASVCQVICSCFLRLGTALWSPHPPTIGASDAPACIPAPLPGTEGSHWFGSIPGRQGVFICALGLLGLTSLPQAAWSFCSRRRGKAQCLSKRGCCFLHQICTRRKAFSLQLAHLANVIHF